MANDTGAIEVKNIPQVFQKALVEAKVLAHTDGKPKDISAKDILEGWKESAYTHNWCGSVCTDDNKIPGALRNLQKFFSYYYLTNSGKERVMEQDIADLIPSDNYGNDPAYNLINNLDRFEAKLKYIRGADILAKNNVAVTIENNFADQSLRNAKIKFKKRSDGGIQITGRVRSGVYKDRVDLGKDLDYTIDASKLAKLQEIRFKKIDGGNDCTYAYVMSAVYSDGTEEWIATLDKYTSSGGGF